MSWRGGLSILLGLTLSACSSRDMSDLKQYIAEVKARPPGDIDPIPEIKPVETFTYEPGDRRDPFVIDRETVEAVTSSLIASSGIAPDPLRRKEELERFPLDSLTMQGTLEQDGIMWGLIRDPEGTLHLVRTGNYMGLNDGQIIRISEEEIELTEIVPGETPGTWREQRASIALSQ